MNKLKWITISEYIDVETGEIITKSKYEREYIKIKITKSIEITEYYGIRKLTTECKPNGQYQFEY